MRLAFKASTRYEDIPQEDDIFVVHDYSDVMTTNGWVKAKSLCVGDILVCDDDGNNAKVVVRDLSKNDNNIVVKFEEEGDALC